MEIAPIIVVVSFCLSCYGLAVASAVLPWLNAELMVLAVAGQAPSPARLAAIAMLATAGQVTGKAIVYWAARRATNAGASHLPTRVEAWRARAASRSAHPFAWALLSAVVGVPPLYVVTLLAGAARLSFPRFLCVTAAGRLVHFAALLAAPQVLQLVLR